MGKNAKQRRERKAGAPPRPSRHLEFLDRAKWLMLGVQTLVQHHPEPTPIYLLGGFVLEIALKGFLQSKGLQDSTLKAYGHDLELLWREATVRGLDVDDKAPPPWVQLLSRLHKSHTLRYADGSAHYFGPGDPNLFRLQLQDAVSAADWGATRPGVQREWRYPAHGAVAEPLLPSIVFKLPNGIAGS